ncbi:hypothetical protein [Mycoplasma capricolum]
MNKLYNINILYNFHTLYMHHRKNNFMTNNKQEELKQNFFWIDPG